MPRSAVAILLPPPEFVAVRDQLADAGYEGIAVESADGLEQLLTSRTDVGAAILDGENYLDRTLEMYGVLHAHGRNIPALLLMPQRSLGRMGLGAAEAKDEYFIRPYSAESLRWRIEAMLIRVDREPEEEGTESALVGGDDDVLPLEAPSLEAPAISAATGPADDGHKRGKIVIVFNPKGGVGKTTISINLGAALQLHRGQRVLLVDCDTITGHIAQSLGLERPRTLASAWREDAAKHKHETVAQIATVHSSGVSVLVMAESPLHTEALEPREGRRCHHQRPRVLRLGHPRHAPGLRAAEPGALRGGRQDPRAGYAGRSLHQGCGSVPGSGHRAAG